MVMTFYEVLGLGASRKEKVRVFAKESGISLRKMKYYNEHHILPNEADLAKIEDYAKVPKMVVMLKMGIFNQEMLEGLARLGQKERVKSLCQWRPNMVSSIMVIVLTYLRTQQVIPLTWYSLTHRLILRSFISQILTMICQIRNTLTGATNGSMDVLGS
jgi:hypothetical protein